MSENSTSIDSFITPTVRALEASKTQIKESVIEQEQQLVELNLAIERASDELEDAESSKEVQLSSEVEGVLDRENEIRAMRDLIENLITERDELENELKQIEDESYIDYEAVSV